MDMETQVLQALARGYGHPENSGKVVDPDLIKAMAKEIIESFSPSRESISSNAKLSGIEKIEPMKIALGSFLGDTFGQETRLAAKLNQVIENQNKIIDYLNQQVKK